MAIRGDDGDIRDHAKICILILVRKLIVALPFVPYLTGNNSVILLLCLRLGRIWLRRGRFVAMEGS